MRRSLTLFTCVAFMASLIGAASADPISGTVTVTVEPSGTLVTAVPYMYSACILDMSNTTYNGEMFGDGLLGSPGPIWNPPINIDIQTTFNMTVTFDGASGSHPTIDLTGPLTVEFNQTDLTSSSPYYAMGYNPSTSLTARGTPTTATLQGWTPSSGVPMSLINEYLNPSSYDFFESGEAMTMAMPPEQLSGGVSLGIHLSAGAEAPEPSSVLVCLAAIAGLAVRRGARLWQAGRVQQGHSCTYRHYRQSG